MIIIKVFSVFLIIILGIIVRKKNLISSVTINEISVIITKIFYPALIFSSFFKNFNSNEIIKNYLLPLGTILIMTVGYIYGVFISKFLKFKNEKEKNVFRFQCTINNYSFLPLPIIILLYGEKYGSFLILSTFGSEISVWTIGILSLTGNRLKKESFKNILSIPMISIILSVIFIFLRDFISIKNTKIIEIGDSILNTITLVGNATIPVALFIAGAKMGEIKFKNIFNFNSLILSLFRLIIIPFTSIFLFYIFSFPDEIRKVLNIVAIMPSAIASIVLSEAFGSNSEFAAETVFLTHILSLITVPFFLYFLSG